MLLRGLPLLVSLLSVATRCKAAPESDRIQKLPGWDKSLPSKQYSGYLDGGQTKKLHYWFVESEGNPAKDPVVLWLNGGPGCSSLDGFLYEHGPFHVQSDDHTKLYYNKHAWTKIANVIYIESPVGVGFSYADNKDEYTTNDNITAAQNHHALEDFFKKFPEYTSNEFYITGESYAGIYVPTLAESIMYATDAKKSSINLKGFAVGNGCTGTEIGVCGADPIRPRLQFCHKHALISDDTYHTLNKKCKDWSSPDAECLKWITKAGDEIGSVDIYNIYGQCLIPKQSTEQVTGIWDISRKMLEKTTVHASDRPQRLTKAPLPVTLSRAFECQEDVAAADWLNQREVQEALHVKAPVSGDWSVCARIPYTPNRKNLPKEIYPELIKRYRTLIFNGDVDACVPFIDNEAWTSNMGYDVIEHWRPWVVDDQLAGYVTVYDANHFTFLTVKGAGHMVPQVKPLQGFEMFKRFLKGEGY